MDLAINLGIDAKKSDQNVRGSTVLPHGNGKTVRVAVFAQGAKAEEAKTAGADVVGMQDLADKMKAGELNYQVVIAAPDAMRVVGALGQVLGPRGLMPNPKTGTVTPDVATAVKNAKAGMAKFRTDKAGIVHCSIGSADFEPDKDQGKPARGTARRAQAAPALGQGHLHQEGDAVLDDGPRASAWMWVRCRSKSYKILKCGAKPLVRDRRCRKDLKEQSPTQTVAAK